MNYDRYLFNDFIGVKRKSRRAPAKKLKKLGTVKIGFVETTPVVFNERLLRFEWVRSKKWKSGSSDHREMGYYHFVDMETEQETGAPFAHGNAFGCCYAENGVMYAHGVGGNGAPCNYIDVFWSRDLINWQTQRALTLPEGYRIYNTSVCKDSDGYLMVIEVDGPREIVGEPFTIVFAKSHDLLNWELMPMDKYAFYKESYSACPSVRYIDGMYYIVYLEALPFYSFAPYVVRTRDFVEFEVGFNGPFMMFDENDKKIIYPENFTPEELEYINTCIDTNNSDVDFCEWCGKTVITYSWGNQLGCEFLALAEYNGTLEELLKSYF